MVTLRHIGKSADDLRFFIRSDGAHAGGVTVHSVRGDTFSYGILVVPALRGQGVAREALTQLFALMRARGFARAAVAIAPDNAASLALHRSLGFAETSRDEGAVRMERALPLIQSPSSARIPASAGLRPRRTSRG